MRPASAGDKARHPGPPRAQARRVESPWAVTAMTVEGCTDGTVFLAFLREVLGAQLRPGPLLIMDTLKAHQVAGVADVCAAAGVRLLSLPPYSPDFSPIAEC